MLRWENNRAKKCCNFNQQREDIEDFKDIYSFYGLLNYNNIFKKYINGTSTSTCSDWYDDFNDLLLKQASFEVFFIILQTAFELTLSIGSYDICI